MNNYAITGLARCGKDTISKMISKRQGQELYALALPIKDIMCDLFSWDEEHRDGSYKEIPMIQTITLEALELAGMTYNSYGLNKYQEFWECWEWMVKTFEIEIHDEGHAHCKISPRQAFQLFGTEWGRSVDPEIWLKIAPLTNVIITDIRFDNEARFFREKGFKVIAVSRPYFGKIASSGHSSENGIDPLLIDFPIINSGTLEELREKVNLYFDSK